MCRYCRTPTARNQVRFTVLDVKFRKVCRGAALFDVQRAAPAICFLTSEVVLAAPACGDAQPRALQGSVVKAVRISVHRRGQYRSTSMSVRNLVAAPSIGEYRTIRRAVRRIISHFVYSLLRNIRLPEPIRRRYVGR
jgi:hypothetical protein